MNAEKIQSNMQVYKAILLYSVIFVVIRLAASQYGMTYDEAEQFIDTQSFVLGYSDQPPLYSWILKSFSYIFGLNVPMMVLTYHAIAIGFLIYLYKAIYLFFEDRAKSLFCFLSYTLFFIYSYDFYRYTIHTALMMLLCVVSLYIYLKIYKGNASTTNYLLLGASFALGLLSKYNFIFFILAIVISSLFTKKTREILFSFKTILAIALCLLIFSPHLIWIFQNDLEPIHYALSRGEAGASNEEFSLISVLLNTYWNYLVYFGVITLFFFKDFKKELGNSFFNKLLIFSIVFPLALIIILKAGNFTQRWLAPLNLFLPLAIFSYIKIENKRLMHKLFKIGIVILFVVFYSMRICSYYFPDQFGPSFLSKPYKAIYSNLKKDFYNNGFSTDQAIYSFMEKGILAGIKSFNKDIVVKVINPSDDIDLHGKILVWSEENDKKFEKYLKKNNLDLKQIYSKSSPYLFSREKEIYKVNFALTN